jgi:23S rRNA pseudouridine2457 synthase
MPREKYIYYKLYKPFRVLSQFSDIEGRKTLKDLFNFPDDVYPVGRLDYDSEGLLILTNDRLITGLLLNPAYEHKREYFVQVEGIPEEKDLELFKNGLIIKGRKTQPASAELISAPPVPARNPPVRFRKHIPDSWLKIILTEGKNRQVRRMTAAIGFPTLRLIRVRIENITLDNMNPGEVRKLSSEEINGLAEIKSKLSHK